MNDDTFGIIVLIGIVILILGSIIYFVNLSTEANDIATRMCKERGQQTYIHFNMKCCSSYPYNLVCGSMKERMIFEGRIKGYTFNDKGNKTIILNLENPNVK